jgi:uncharacterized protein (TIGR02466 family)
MIKSTIEGLFPIPIYRTKINRNLTKKELLFVDKNKINCNTNYGNNSSLNTNVLDEKIFEKLKNELNLIIQDYFEKVISPADNITPYITQSWLNYTKKNQYHHKHSHPNSLVSGIFYIDCNEEFDKIKFFNESYDTIEFTFKNWNLWNSKSWWFSVKTGDIILFPSSLEHMVENKEGNNTRISLAFNVFIKGVIGAKNTVTELVLK